MPDAEVRTEAIPVELPNGTIIKVEMTQTGGALGDSYTYREPLYNRGNRQKQRIHPPTRESSPWDMLQRLSL